MESRSLDAYLGDLETRVKAGTVVLDRSALSPTKGPIRGKAADEWRKFLDSRTVHVKSTDQQVIDEERR